MQQPKPAPRDTSPDAAAADNVTAVLGPTNTGKTHLAVERMLGYSTGMIGLPLRLLAREIYDRVVRERGTGAVALITGEEKIVPANPRYYVCTVESMPMALPMDFVAIDEIQLCADPDRGHIFTERLLYARGRYETMFLGAETMRPVIRRLLPGARFVTRPRFSHLTYAGSRKLSRMPRRSAIVAFSADQVYGIAELVRRQRGGAAVVMGALSPRTRNAQVALYQSGEVDFLVATDAIGMGLNMDVNHVAFAGLGKFDGVGHRNLWPNEVAQIAGRAGRYQNDGTFGTTGEAGMMDEDLVEQVENHRFDAIRVVKWRNSRLEYGSLAHLITSLEQPSPARGLGRIREASDVVALKLLAADVNVADMACNPDAVRRLWNVCQVPDFRKVTHDMHARLLAELYHHVMSDAGVLPEDYVARHVNMLDRDDGEIDTLSARIAHIRTWTFVANRAGWLSDSAYWRGRTREVEDKLSDALHERLTQRFIDRRTSLLMKRLHQKEELMASLNSSGDVLVEGQFVGRLDGFRFEVDPQAHGVHSGTLRNAAYQALQGEIAARAFRLDRHARIDEGKIIAIDDEGQIRWEGMAVARLSAGHDVLSPKIDLLADPDLLSGQPAVSLRESLEAWLARHIATVLEPLVALKKAEGLDGMTRGLAFQLAEAMGILPRAQVAGDVKGLDQTERGKLRKLGVRFGEWHIYLPALIKPGPTVMKLKLWRIANPQLQGENGWQLQPPGAGLSSVPVDPAAPQGFYNIVGFEPCGPRAVRIDMLDRLVGQLRKVNNPRGFPLTPDLWSPVGCGVEDFEGVIRALGYVPVEPAPEVADAAQTGKPEAETESPEPEIAEPGAEAQHVADNAPSVAAEAPLAAVSEAQDGLTAETAEPAETDLAAPADSAIEAAPAAAADAESADTAPSESVPQESAEAPKPATLWRFKPKPQNRRSGRRGKPRTGQQQAKSGQPSRRGKQTGGATGAKQATGPGKGGRKRAARPVDPDSPFAALQALKDRMKTPE